jgi:TolB-like protein
MTAEASDMPEHKLQRSYTRDQEIRTLEALDHIIASGVLGAGERMPAMLRYLVREELAGRGNRIKSFSIATEVLGRSHSFDPQSDSIARAEMTRLRKAINLYNATVGPAQLVRFDIPKGSYRPVITGLNVAQVAITGPDNMSTEVPAANMRLAEAPATSPAASSAGPPAAHRTLLALAAMALLALAVLGAAWQMRAGKPAASSKPPLLVIQPTPQSDRNRLAELSEAIGHEVAFELSRQPWLAVIQPHSLAEVDTALKTAAAIRAVYLLDIRVAAHEGSYRANAFLKRWPDHVIRWSSSHDGPSLARHSGNVLQGVAATIAREVAAPGGAITQSEVARADGEELHERRFICLMRVRRYWRSYDPALRSEAESCLTATTASDPRFASGRAALAYLRIESARRERGEKRKALLEAADSLLSGPDTGNLIAEGAAMALAACKGDRAKVRMLADALRRTYPNNPDVLADVGSKVGLFLGDWATALDVEARAVELNPLHDPWYPLSTVAKAMLDGEPTRALAVLADAPQRNFRVGQVIRLAAGGAAGDTSVIADATAILTGMGIADINAAREVIERQCWSIEAKQIFQRGLDHAGL